MFSIVSYLNSTMIYLSMDHVFFCSNTYSFYPAKTVAMLEIFDFHSGICY